MSVAPFPLAPVRPPKVVAIATSKSFTPKTPFPDSRNLPGVPAPKYGQDITSGANRAAPKNQNVGSTEAQLKAKMRKLLDIFASGDQSGMAKRLFDEFLQKQSNVKYFDDPALTKAAKQHPNIKFFMDAALSAPNLSNNSAGKTRIHQALQKAKWDIKKMKAPTDLGTPAFTRGDPIFQNQDYNNGLGLMINDVSYVYVVAQNYHPQENMYWIRLKYIFYDVFGLDDGDLNDRGAHSTSHVSDAAQGITAWWQLQHQHSHSPLVTRIMLTKTYEVPIS